MTSLEKHEVLEMEVLDAMRRTKVLDRLVFGGGTMLRLCYELKRYSMDLDFWLRDDAKAFAKSHTKIKQMLRDMGAEISEAHAKRHTYLYEIRKAGFPHRLKIEVRKERARDSEIQQNIAFSPNSPLQVRLFTFRMDCLWQRKVKAFLNRKIIRDAYDLEFLSRRGAGDVATLPRRQKKAMLAILDGFTTAAYRSVLGAVLRQEERDLFKTYRFDYLKSKLQT